MSEHSYLVKGKIIEETLHYINWVLQNVKRFDNNILLDDILEMKYVNGD